MYSEVITYTDFDGNEVSERHYFNISKAELARMNLGHAGGIYEYLKLIVSSKDQLKINEYFEKIVDMSYGIKLDNKHFKKSPEILDEFKSSLAYDEWFYKLCTDAEYSTKFINAVLPKEISDQTITEEDKAKIAEDFAIDKSLI